MTLRAREEKEGSAMGMTSVSRCWLNNKVDGTLHGGVLSDS